MVGIGETLVPLDDDGGDATSGGEVVCLESPSFFQENFHQNKTHP